MSNPGYTRPQAAELAKRLDEPRRFLQVVAGPRQVGKTTLVTQVTATARLPHVFASADEPTLRGLEWIEAQWDAARLLARDAGPRGALLVLDEVQKVPSWSETVKRLWDADTRPALAQGCAPRLGAAPTPTGAHGKPGGPLRDPAPAALDARRNA